MIGTSLPWCHPSVLKRVCSPPLVAWKCIESSDQDFFGYRDERQKDLSLLEVLKVFVILLVPISKDLFILTFMLVYYKISFDLDILQDPIWFVVSGSYFFKKLLKEVFTDFFLFARRDPRVHGLLTEMSEVLGL